MRRFALTPCLFLPLAAAAQQMPAPVEQPLAPALPSHSLIVPPDFYASGSFAAMAATQTAITALPPIPVVSGTGGSPLQTSAQPPQTSLEPHIIPSQPLHIRPISSGKYLLLPQESPLATAPLGTLNPATLAEETETALPEKRQKEQPFMMRNSLVTAPMEERMLHMAERIEALAARAEIMEQRGAALAEETPPSPAASPTTPQAEATAAPPQNAAPAPLTAVIPYVNDATAPGPRARAALQKLAQDIIATAARTGQTPSRMKVSARVAAPPLGTPAGVIARQRHTACWLELNKYLAPHGLKLAGTGNKLTVAETPDAAAQSQTITIVW